MSEKKYDKTFAENDPVAILFHIDRELADEMSIQAVKMRKSRSAVIRMMLVEKLQELKQVQLAG